MVSPELERSVAAEGRRAYQMRAAGSTSTAGGRDRTWSSARRCRPGSGRSSCTTCSRSTSEDQIAELVQATVLLTGVALVVLLAVLGDLVTRLVVQPGAGGRPHRAAALAPACSTSAWRYAARTTWPSSPPSFNQMAANLQRQIVRLEEMSRLQRRFTSDVSHELRTPLTTVRMAADLIFTQREDFDPAVARSAELLQAELDRFESLLTDLLEISRFDAGFAMLDAEPTDLVPVVRRVADRLASLAERAGVELRVRPAGRPGDRRGRPAPGRADPAQPGRQRRRARRGPAGRGDARRRRDAPSR